ncbi:hypothetical protein WL29_22890 [Burkholderia ubonensis]|uniref:Transmembrane protein n=1 Tax=Burkholderia ubonensis TaxID=101571 RepID=A0A125DMF3_9BURK|nr:hypothetical protein [Burkholderia ubonensis]KWA84210.1 hypothetical protein WL29_22890 [Burkholderia ubonensis]
MAIFGWIVLTGVMVVLSIGWCALAAFSLGPYTIGGVPNSLLKKVYVLSLGGILGFGWWFLIIKHAPFTIVLN